MRSSRVTCACRLARRRVIAVRRDCASTPICAKRLRAIDGLLLLSRNAGRLLRRNTLTETELIAAGYQPEGNADNAEPRVAPQDHLPNSRVRDAASRFKKISFKMGYRT